MLPTYRETSNTNKASSIVSFLTRPICCPFRKTLHFSVGGNCVMDTSNFPPPHPKYSLLRSSLFRKSSKVSLIRKLLCCKRLGFPADNCTNVREHSVFILSVIVIVFHIFSDIQRISFYLSV